MGGPLIVKPFLIALSLAKFTNIPELFAPSPDRSITLRVLENLLVVICISAKFIAPEIPVRLADIGASKDNLFAKFHADFES